MGWKMDLLRAAKTKEEKNRLLKAYSRGANTPQQAKSYAQGRRGRRHKVRPGETWESITDNPRQELAAIMANPGVKRLHTGMTIWLPNEDPYISHARMAFERGEMGDQYQQSLRRSLGGQLPRGAQEEEYWGDKYFHSRPSAEPTTAIEKAGLSPVTTTTTPQPPQTTGEYSPLNAGEHMAERGGLNPPPAGRDVFPGVPMIDPDTGGFTYISSPQVPSSEELYGQYDQRRMTREQAPDSEQLYGQYREEEVSRPVSRMPSIYDVPTSRDLYERHFQRVTVPIEQPPRGAYGQSGLAGEGPRWGEGLNTLLGSAVDYLGGRRGEARRAWEGLLRPPALMKGMLVEAPKRPSIADVPTSDELAAPRLQGDARPGVARRTPDDLVNAWLARHGIMTDNPEYQAAIVKELYKRGVIQQEEVEWAINRGAFEMRDIADNQAASATDFYGGGNTQYGSYYPYSGFGSGGGGGGGAGYAASSPAERPGMVGRTFGRGTRGVRWTF
jgi:hypothetical protein